MKGSVIIAIDGTSASGKSTNARIVAKELGFLHVDTAPCIALWRGTV